MNISNSISSGAALDVVLNSTDQFFAGVASTVTGGLTDQIRTQVYGDIATMNHQGTLYTAGRVAGIAPAIAVGVYAGATAQHAGTLIQTARTLNTVTTIYGTTQAGYNIATGNGTVWDAAAVIAPAAAGASRYFQWIQCFEAETPVATDWEFISFEVAGGLEASHSWDAKDTFWVAAAGGLLIVAAWPQSGGTPSRLCVRRRKETERGTHRHRQSI